MIASGDRANMFGNKNMYLFGPRYDEANAVAPSEDLAKVPPLHDYLNLLKCRLN